MKTSEINQNLIGKRVKGITFATPVTGTIVEIVEEYCDVYKPFTCEKIGQSLCSKGVKIRLDEGVRWGDDIYTEYVSTARICDDWGNLQHTELLN